MKSIGYSRESSVITMSSIIPSGVIVELSASCILVGVALNPSIFKFAWRMYKRGLKKELIAVMLGIYTTARLGLAAKVTPDVRHLLQRSPISMEEFVRSYQASWML